MAECLEASSSEEELHVLQHEFDKLITTSEKIGFSDGIVAGEDIALQDGFNKGFSYGLRQASPIAKLKGVISALQVYQEASKTINDKLPHDTSRTVQDLLMQINVFEANVRKCMMESREHQSAILVGESTISSSSSAIIEQSDTNEGHEDNVVDAPGSLVSTIATDSSVAKLSEDGRHEIVNVGYENISSHEIRHKSKEILSSFGITNNIIDEIYAQLSI